MSLDPLPRLCGLLVLTAALLAAVANAATPLAFPGADGHGRFASGGRGGVVLEVTNLNDSGPGSLRAAVDASGPRTIVFRVSGTIFLNSNLTIRNDNVTIAGQTAPGDGICLANYSLLVSADNVIIRFLRVRVGDLGSPDGADGRDAMFARYTDRVILDHCSFSWSIDETASAYFNSNFTMQWCLISESLRLSLHSKDAHGYGGIWGGQGASFHHNLLAHHTSRNPRLNGSRNMPAVHNGTAFEQEQADLRNNVIYNWSSNSCYGGEPRNDGLPSLYNFVGCYYKPGPATPSSRWDRIVQPTPVNGVYSQFFLKGTMTPASPATTADNWLGVDGPGPEDIPVMRLPVAASAEPLVEQDGNGAYEAVLQYVGACFPSRDSHDTRIVHEVETGTATYGSNGIIDSQSEVGGWPVLESVPAPVDTDHDGMPDEWESARGLNPSNAADRNGDPDGDGHTHLEDYLNSLVNHLYPKPVFEARSAEGTVMVAWENQLNDRQLEQSGDLVAWQYASTDQTGSYGEVPVDTDSTTAQFFRLNSGNKAPTVTLASPGLNATFYEGQGVLLSAQAEDTDGTVTKVEFFIDGNSYATVTGAPFARPWTASGDGAHEVSAVVTDNLGATTTTGPIGFWVLGSHAAEGTTYHAEVAYSETWNLLEREHGGFYGSGYVNFDRYTYVEFREVDGGSGGMARITFRFALGVEPAREGLLVINGTDNYPLIFQPTGGWSNWAEMSMEVPLAPGSANTVMVFALADDLANLDEIVVVPNVPAGI